MPFNCIVPVSLILQLEQLYINIYGILYFKNDDLNKEEVDLNNLKILSIIRAYRKDQTGNSDAYYYIDEDQFEL